MISFNSLMEKMKRNVDRKKYDKEVNEDKLKKNIQVVLHQIDGMKPQIN